jgi:hypothetical protein
MLMASSTPRTIVEPIHQIHRATDEISENTYTINVVVATIACCCSNSSYPMVFEVVPRLTFSPIVYIFFYYAHLHLKGLYNKCG